MMDVQMQIDHERAWLLLPWLANGRLPASECEAVEAHVRQCARCSTELATQRLLCGALNEPDCVTYAPGPSFRKLMARIDSGEEGPVRTQPAAPRRLVMTPRRIIKTLGEVSLWRPPGLAWAASFLILFGITGALTTAYRWSEPAYRTHTANASIAPDVLHIALDRSLTVAEVEELLRASGARVVEGPSSTGIFGVIPADVGPGRTSASNSYGELRTLAARLRTDSRVLWVQPLPGDEISPPRSVTAPREN